MALPADLNLSVQWAEKGSYREEHILQFLRRWLDPWTEERAARKDYRILMLDVAKSHVSDEVVKFSWTRGYVVLFHYGCTTGVAQVNDTDLHGWLEQLYLEIEQAAFNEQQLYQPGCVNRNPQDVVNDAASTWQQVDHGTAVTGHWRTGLSNKLDGSEDHMITREARLMWQEGDMKNVRLRAMQEVDERVAAGEIKEFSDWQKLIVHPGDPGVQADEGAELCGEACADDMPWATEADEKVLAEDDAAVLDMREQEPAPVVVEAKAGDAPEDVEEASHAARRLELLKRLRAETLRAKVPAAFFNVDREVGQLERGLRADTGKKRKVNHVLRRAVEEAADKQAAARRASMAKARKTAELQRQLRAKAAKQAKAKREAQEAKKALQQKLDALPQTWSAKDCGDPKKSYKCRRDCLERLKLRSPALTFEEDAHWPKTRDAYAKNYPKGKKGPAGVLFINEINDVLKALGVHYNGKTKFNAKGGDEGSVNAFAKYFRSMAKKIPQASLAATM